METVLQSGLSSALSLVAFTVAIIAFFRPWTRYFSRHRDPPGPAGWPIFGNAYDIPHDKQWLKFDEWLREYGHIVRITVLGQPFVILGSAEAALALMESRGTIYSDRPSSVMAGELVGWNRGLGYAPYGDRFRAFRKLFHNVMGPRASYDLLPLQELENLRFLLRMLDAPDRFIEHIRQTTGAVILMIAYGYAIVSDNDPMVKIAEDAMLGFAKASEPGAFLVDNFPFLKHLPGWLPGTHFQTIARAMREDLERLFEVPYEFVKRSMSDGTAIPSFTSRYLEEQQNPTPEGQEFIQAAAAAFYSGGADTTPSSVSSFILAMTLYPSIQDTAQLELDTVVGRDRLPTFADREMLPYINAIVKEVLRWNPAVPLGLPHRLTQDDVFKGFRIPKGALVWANIWSMLHDESIYPEPFEFRPERFLQQDADGVHHLVIPNGSDPSLTVFGFGRRICPGLHLADNSIFIAVASLLSVFRISKAVDKDGREITPDVEYTGFISHPKPFKCSIKPRSRAAEILIRRFDEGNEAYDARVQNSNLR